MDALEGASANSNDVRSAKRQNGNSDYQPTAKRLKPTTPDDLSTGFGEGKCSCSLICEAEQRGFSCYIVDVPALTNEAKTLDSEAHCHSVTTSDTSGADTCDCVSCGYGRGNRHEIKICVCAMPASTVSGRKQSHSHRFKNRFKNLNKGQCERCDRWISDSGASHHMLGDKHSHCIQSVNYQRPVSLTTASGKQDKPAYVCTPVKSLRDRGILTAIYHPDIDVPLLSTRQLLRDRVVQKVSFELESMSFSMANGQEIVEEMSPEDPLPFISMPVCESNARGFCAEANCCPGAAGSADELVCEPAPVAQANSITTNTTTMTNINTTAAASKLTNSLRHLRHMHVHDPKGCQREKCLGCLMGRVTTQRGAKERPECKAPEKCNERCCCDFVGPWPESHMGSTQLFIVSDEFDRWVECYATASRTCCGEFLDQWVRDNGRMNVIRSDNAREFKEANAPLRKHAEKWLKDGEPIRVEHGPPYSPWSNGLAERANRTVIEIVRSSLVGCDVLLWDLCAVAAAHVINRVLVRRWRPPGSKLPKRKATAYEIRKGMKAPTGYFRRWGCLCFIKEQHPDDKPSPRRTPAMFVGYARNGCWKVLTWRADGRVKTGFRLSLEESKQVAFVENILIRDVKLLRDFTAKVGTHDFGSGVLRHESLGVSLGNQSLEFEVHPNFAPDGNGTSKSQQSRYSSDIDKLAQSAIDSDQSKTEASLIESVWSSKPEGVSDGVEISKEVKTSEGAVPDGKQQATPQSTSLTDGEISDLIHNGDDDSGKVEKVSTDGLEVTIKRRGRPRKSDPSAVPEKAKPQTGSSVQRKQSSAGSTTTTKKKNSKHSTTNKTNSKQSTTTKTLKKLKAKAASDPEPLIGKGKKIQPKQGNGKAKGKLKSPLKLAAGPIRKPKASKKSRVKAKRAFLQMMNDGSSRTTTGKPGPWGLDLDEGELIDSIDLRLMHRDALGKSGVSARWVEVAIPTVEQVHAHLASVSAHNATVPKKEALHGKDSKHHRQSMAKERCTLEALGCWREPTPEERLDRKVQTLPTALIFTRKRPCAEFPEGKFKCRLVVLGNLQTIDDPKSVFAPVSSYPAARATMINSCAQGLTPLQFDIKGAFVQSVLKEQVNVRLPPEWNDYSPGSSTGRVVRLVRALYGLRISPVTWYRCFRDFICDSLNWIENLREPGTFRKQLKDGSWAYLLLYVDDALVFASSYETGKHEVDQILQKFEGNIVPPVKTDGTSIEMDYLGLQVQYDATRRYLKIYASAAIERIRKKFNFGLSTKYVPYPGTREDLTPTEEELKSLGDQKIKDKSVFPLRALIGSLNYLSVTSRPDISQSVNRIAQFQATPTPRIIEGGKRILRYLVQTSHDGLVYSPEREAEFNRIFRQAAEAGGKADKYGNLTAFSDADWMGCSTSLKSTTGSLWLLRGCPVHWQSRKQTLRADSTLESELFSAVETVKVGKAQGWGDWIIEPEIMEKHIHFVDNQSLLHLSKQSITSKRSKHIGLRWLTIREHADRMCFIGSKQNLSDGLTKCMTVRQLLDPTLVDLQSEQQPAEACCASVCIADFLF